MKYILSFILVGLIVIGCGDDGNGNNLNEVQQIEDFVSRNNLSTTVTPSGLHYSITGPQNGGSPEPNNIIIIKFTQFLLNEPLPAAVAAQPSAANLSGLIFGLQEGIMLLQKGDTGIFLMPSAIAFGSGGTNNVPPNTPIGFVIELVDYFKDREAYEKNIHRQELQQIEDYLTENNLTAETTDSGLYYIIDEAGEGDNPTTTSTVEVNYKGYLLNGTVFDETKDDPLVISLGSVILGWREGIPLFKKGGKGLLLIPSKLAYGSSGSGDIPSYTPIVFEIELVDFN